MASPADIKSIFLAATERPLAERAAFLDAACGGDAALRQRLEALLKAHDNTGGWLGEGATPTSDYPGFSAPAIEELAPHFPHLEILEMLGQGGMGAVYKAKQRNLDRLIALKILPHDAADHGFTERFTREARTLAKLSHPGIVAVHDFGTSGDYHWFVMEFVDGVNLRQARKAGTLTPAAALAIVPQICEALQYAHDAGVVHRDIKPENVLLDAKGRVKIADFGLAKLVGRPDRSQLTGTHQAMGTPHYMAPEQWEKPLEVDHRADIYSLGVVFYEMLTGELPLGRFAPPSTKVQVDVRLDDVVLKTLEKEPERRYQQASQLKLEVENISSPTFRPAPIAAPKLPVQRSFFRQVLLLPLIIAFVGILALVVYSLFPSDSWDAGVRQNITAVTVIAIWISGCVLALNLGRWYFERRQQAMAQWLETNPTVSPKAMAAARRRIGPPSCGLLLVGLATMFVSLGVAAWCATTLVRIAQSPSEPQAQKTGGMTVTTKPHAFAQYKPVIIGVLLVHVAAVALGGVIAFAAICMRRMEHLNFVRAASLAAMLPVSVVWPVALCDGLWAFLTVWRRDVAAAFDRNGAAPVDSPFRRPSWPFVLALGACAVGYTATVIPWSRMSIFGISVTSFGFDVWNGIVAGLLFLGGGLLLIALELVNANRIWKVAATLGAGFLAALVIAEYFWQATGDAKVTSSTGDEFLRPFAENFFASGISGHFSVGPFVSAVGAALMLLCGGIQVWTANQKRPAASSM
jgi:predicted Ser/Thr protein kinase